MCACPNHVTSKSKLKQKIRKSFCDNSKQNIQKIFLTTRSFIFNKNKRSFSTTKNILSIQIMKSFMKISFLLNEQTKEVFMTYIFFFFKNIYIRLINK